MLKPLLKKQALSTGDSPPGVCRLCLVDTPRIDNHVQGLVAQARCCDSDVGASLWDVPQDLSRLDEQVAEWNQACSPAMAALRGGRKAPAVHLDP